MIVSVGEVVWDIFADKQVLGGAPINVAYHLNSLHMDVQIITRVGTDALGDKTLDKLASLGLSLDGVQKDNQLPTGTVNVTVDEHNEPHFDIVAPVAWDNISLDDAEKVVGDSTFSLVFGTLAQRDERTRKVIHALWDKSSTRFYDVNLRPPFTTKELVLDSLKVADIVKVNGYELVTIAEWNAIDSSDKKTAAQLLLNKYKIIAVVVTEGKDGAWLVTVDGFYSNTAPAVTVADTVGAGDAFFATLIEGYLKGREWPDCLARANKRGGYVASQHGATPSMPD